MRLSQALPHIGNSQDPKAWGQVLMQMALSAKRAETAKALGKLYLKGGGLAAGFALKEGNRNSKIDAAKAIELARAAGRIDELLEFAKFGVDAADAVPEIEPAVDRTQRNEPSIAVDKDAMKAALEAGAL